MPPIMQTSLDANSICLRSFSERLVRIKGQPFTLHDRPYLHAIYADMAPKLILRGSRQIEKSTYLSNRILWEAHAHPGRQIFFVAPRHQQARLFSKSRLRAVISDSRVLRRLLWGSDAEIPLSDIVFPNGSTIYIRSAF